MSDSFDEFIAQLGKDSCNLNKIGDVFIDMPDFGEYWEKECSGVSDFYLGEEEGDYVAANLFGWASYLFFNHHFLLSKPIEPLAFNKINISRNVFDGGGQGSITTTGNNINRYRCDWDLIGYTPLKHGIELIYRYSEYSKLRFEGTLKIFDNDGDWIITGDAKAIQLRRGLNQKIFENVSEDELISFYKSYINNLLGCLKNDLTEVNVLKHVEMFLVSEDIWRLNEHKTIEDSFLEMKIHLINLYHNIGTNTLEESLYSVNTCIDIINQFS